MKHNEDISFYFMCDREQDFNFGKELDLCVEEQGFNRWENYSIIYNIWVELKLNEKSNSEENLDDRDDNYCDNPYCLKPNCEEKH